MSSRETSIDEPFQTTPSLALYVLIIIQCICTLIISPLSVYYAYKFYKLSQQNIPFFSKRHPKLVLFTVFVYNLYPLIIRPVSDYLWLHHLLGYIYIPPHFQFIPFLLNLTIHTLVYLNVTRLWILYFDYCHCLQSFSVIWKTRVTKEKTYKPWTFKYKQLGSMRILMLFWAIFSVLLLLYFGFFLVNELPYPQLIALIPCVIALVLMCKIRQTRDQFAIKREFAWFVAVNIAVIVIYGAGIRPYFGIESVSRIIILNVMTNMSCYIYCYICTCWVIHKYYQQKKFYEQQSKLTVDNTDIPNMSLEDVLSTKDGFDLFARHLVKEFCSESLLFLYEMMQIKNQLIATNLLHAEELGILVKVNTKRIHKARRENGKITSVDTLKENLRHIVNTYIDGESEHSINISSRTRRKILSLFTKCQDEVYNVPKFDWISTRNIYETPADTPTMETPASITSPLDLNRKSLHRMPAIDDVKIDPLKEAPTLEWIDGRGNYSLDNERIQNDYKLMMEYLHAFDKAIQEVSCLLNGDTLFRFYCTDDYQRVLKQHMSLTNTDTCN